MAPFSIAVSNDKDVPQLILRAFVLAIERFESRERVLKSSGSVVPVSLIETRTFDIESEARCQGGNGGHLFEHIEQRCACLVRGRRLQFVQLNSGSDHMVAREKRRRYFLFEKVVEDVRIKHASGCLSYLISPVVLAHRRIQPYCSGVRCGTSPPRLFSIAYSSICLV
jgi:hypothetical protein